MAAHRVRSNPGKYLVLRVLDLIDAEILQNLYVESMTAQLNADNTYAETVE